MQPDIVKPAIRQRPNIHTGNPNDSLPTALMDDLTVIMDDPTAVMGQPHSTDEVDFKLKPTIVKPAMRP
jgi:hypothetical protein